MIRQFTRFFNKSTKYMISVLSPAKSNMSTQVDDVLISEVKNKGIIVLNRPKALNALNLSMVMKIHPVLKDWESKKTLVLVKGAGEKAFCAGGDVRAVVEAGFKGKKDLGQDFFKLEYATNGLIGSYKIPYIAFIDGIVMGGGVGLSVHGKYRVATEKTLFAMPETQIGFFPDVGGSYFLSRLKGKLGWYLALTGQRLRGSDVLNAGIATHFIDSKDIHKLEDALLNCSNESDIVNVLNTFSKKEVPVFSLESVLDKIDNYFGSGSVEEIVEKLKKDDSKWAKDTLVLLSKMSPTSLKVAFKQLDLGKSYSLQNCLQMEYNMCLTFLENKDFYEGVRALLIDKDQKPTWKPSKLEEVSTKIVNEYFSNLPTVKSAI